MVYPFNKLREYFIERAERRRFNATIEDARLRRQKDGEEVAVLCTEIGRTLLICTLVEQQLHDVLRDFGFDNEDIPEWLQRGSNKKKLHKAIEQLPQRFKASDELIATLESFRERRNEFVHNLWRHTGPHSVSNEESRKRLLEFIRPLYADARLLTKVFGNFLLKEHSTDLLSDMPSFIRRVCSGYAPMWGVLRTRLV